MHQINLDYAIIIILKILNKLYVYEEQLLLSIYQRSHPNTNANSTLLISNVQFSIASIDCYIRICYKMAMYTVTFSSVADRSQTEINEDT